MVGTVTGKGGGALPNGKDRLIARYSRMRKLQKRNSNNNFGHKNLIKELFCV